MNTNETKKLTLNYRNTFFIACSFFSILMLWQVYNHYTPLFLEQLLSDKFQDSKDQLFYVIGMIMAADNFFALFMLPLFGNLSDKTKTKFGKRMPYILLGMLVSAMMFPFIAIMFIQKSLVGLIIMMGIVLITMNIYRSPSVALMPDITPKPLRAKANGIINLVGYIGAILAGGLAMVISPEKPLLAFVIASVFMLAALIILFTTIKENKILKEMKTDLEYGEQLSESFESTNAGKPLSKQDKHNLIVLFISVFFWFMSFNAIETFNSIFSKKILGDAGINGTFSIILTVSSILTFALSANLVKKIKRRNTVLFGLLMIISAFIIITIYIFTLKPVTLIDAQAFSTKKLEHFLSFMNASTLEQVNWSSVTVLHTKHLWILFIAVAIAGIGWAFINLSSYPMIVELSNEQNIGKFTGYYYACSMSAQTMTPVLVGLIMSFNTLGLKLLYVYSSITMLIAFVVFLLYKEKKYKI